MREGHQISIGTNLGGVTQGEHRVPESKMLQGKILNADSEPTAGPEIPQPERLGLHMRDNNQHLGVGILLFQILWLLHDTCRVD